MACSDICRVWVTSVRVRSGQIVHEQQKRSKKKLTRRQQCQTKNWVLQDSKNVRRLRLWLQKKCVLDPTRGMYLHFLHLERVQLLLDPLGECGCEPTPCRRFAAAVVHAGRERVVHTQVICKRESLCGARSRTMGKRRWRGKYCTQHRRTRVEVRVVEKRPF